MGKRTSKSTWNKTIYLEPPLGKKLIIRSECILSEGYFLGDKYLVKDDNDCYFETDRISEWILFPKESIEG